MNINKINGYNIFSSLLQTSKFAEQTVLQRGTNISSKRDFIYPAIEVLVNMERDPASSWLIVAEEEPGEHEDAAGGAEEREDGEVPGGPSPGPVGGGGAALGLDA